jgi:hypothetical protein
MKAQSILTLGTIILLALLGWIFIGFGVRYLWSEVFYILKI